MPRPYQVAGQRATSGYNLAPVDEEIYSRLAKGRNVGASQENMTQWRHVIGDEDPTPDSTCVASSSVWMRELDSNEM